LFTCHHIVLFFPPAAPAPWHINSMLNCNSTRSLQLHSITTDLHPTEPNPKAQLSYYATHSQLPSHKTDPAVNTCPDNNIPKGVTALSPGTLYVKPRHWMTMSYGARFAGSGQDTLLWHACTTQARIREDKTTRQVLCTVASSSTCEPWSQARRFDMVTLKNQNLSLVPKSMIS
jgi:hypothetical protein